MASHEITRPQRELPLRPQDEVECRRCGIHCDKVVYPAACVARSCPFLYAYEEVGRTYVGCMQKVFGVEIDLELLEEAEARAPGFGAVKATRTRCRCARPRWRAPTSAGPTTSAA